jgi:hypothetical protein
MLFMPHRAGTRGDRKTNDSTNSLFGFAVDCGDCFASQDVAAQRNILLWVKQ